MSNFYVNSEHPKDVVLFYFANTVQEADAERLGTALDRLANTHSWVIGPPLFVYQTEDVVDPRTGEPAVTLGGVYEMYSAHGKWRDVLPPEIDRAHYEEFTRIVQLLAELTRDGGNEFHFEFQGEMVGKIREGEPDEMLATQFLESWRQGLRPTTG